MLFNKKKSAIENIIGKEEHRLNLKGLNDSHLGFFPELFEKVKEKINSIDSVSVSNDGKVKVIEKPIVQPPKPPVQQSPFLPLALITACVFFIAKRR